MNWAFASGADQRPAIMGILNVTPDSFSDGGRFLAPDAAQVQVREMLDAGADIIDIGAESSRPGAAETGSDEQLRRLSPVLDAVLPLTSGRALVSVDTRSPDVARHALERGVSIINDISAAAAPGMLETIAEFGAGVVLMHMQGEPATMQDAPRYDDVVASIDAFLRERVAAAQAAGIGAGRIAIDPGIGFGKTRAHNLALVAGLGRFVATGSAVLLGASRKRFMGSLCAETEPTELVGATCATTALGVAAGVRLFRVHDVRANRQAADVAWACLPRASYEGLRLPGS